MAKKTKTFSKIFKTGEVKKTLLDEGVEDETGEDTDDDDFPIEPTIVREENDVFGEGGDDVNDLETFEAAFDDFEKNASEGDVFEGADFPDATAFEGAEDTSDAVDFPADFDQEVEEELNIDDSAFDAAFDASFSGIDAMLKATTEGTQEQCASNGGKTKGKKRLTMLWKKKEEPVSHVGEITVDKSKIPAKKTEATMVRGELVTEQTAGKDKSGKSTFKTLTKTLKKKGAELASGIAARMEDTSGGDIFDNEDNSDAKDNSEENGNQAAAMDSSACNRKDDEMDRSRQRRRRSKTEKDAIPGETQRRRRRESRADHHQKGASRAGGPKSRSGSHDGTGGRTHRSRPSEEGEGKMRRNRTSESAGSGGGRRRQSLLEKHSGAQMSPRRVSAKPRVGDGLDEPKRTSGRSKGMSESARVTSSRRDDLTDSGGRRSNRRRENDIDGSSRRSGEMLDGSAARRRNMGGRRESRRSIRKTNSGDGSELMAGRKRGDMLCSSSHATTYRRAQTMDSMSYQRAQSTRRFGKNDLMGESGHAGKSSVGGGLSDRDRLRRATITENNKDAKLSKKQALGNLYAGGSRGNAEKDKSEGENPPKGDGDIPEETFEEEEDEYSEDEEPLDTQAVIVEESEEEEEEEDLSDESGEMETSNPFLKARTAENLTSEDVEKLVKAVARRAKGAKDDADLENIVMGSLHMSVNFADFMDDEDGGSIGSDPSDEEGGDIDEGGLSRKVVRDRTRNYVNNFLTSNVGGDSRVGKQVTAQLEKIPGHRVKDEAADKPFKGKFDYGGAVSKLASNKIQRQPEMKEGSSSRASTRRLPKGMATKADLVKAAKASEKESSKSDTKQMVDFSAVASRLERKAEAKTKARMRHSIAVVK